MIIHFECFILMPFVYSVQYGGLSSERYSQRESVGTLQNTTTEKVSNVRSRFLIISKSYPIPRSLKSNNCKRNVFKLGEHFTEDVNYASLHLLIFKMKTRLEL